MTKRPEQRWAFQDAGLVVAWVVLLVLGAVIPAFFYAGIVVGLLLVAVLVVRHLQRRRRWRTQPPGEFWADRVKE